ncbi:hypothetical protein [Burkholderia sp. LMG 32019]|uniref:hypothetical protein n=1 Tax=Burkholderia sp. LMG 32019 TaxID=3158173 RepID=UPI003C2EBE44
MLPVGRLQQRRAVQAERFTRVERHGEMRMQPGMRVVLRCERRPRQFERAGWLLRDRSAVALDQADDPPGIDDRRAVALPAGRTATVAASMQVPYWQG